MANTMKLPVDSFENEQKYVKSRLLSRLWSTAETCDSSPGTATPSPTMTPTPSSSPIPTIVDVTSRLFTALRKSNSDSDLDDELPPTAPTPCSSIPTVVDVTSRLFTALRKSDSDSDSGLDDVLPPATMAPTPASSIPTIKNVTSRLFAAVSKSIDDSDLDDVPDAMPVLSVNMLLGFRASMEAEDGDIHESVCQAKLQAPSYESAQSISKVVMPVRRHQAPPPLAPTAGSWSAQHRCPKGGSLDDNEKIARTSRSILNKITADTFDSLFEQLVTCGIQQPEHISTLMSEVFDTATRQHHFIPMYADLCKKLEQDPRISAVVENAGQQHNFRRLLLNQCQNVFEQLLEPCAVELASDEEVCLRRKQEALGNIKLIGHLLVNGMLTSKLLVDCADDLIGKHLTCPEALESLAALMMVAAPTFDTKEWQYHEKLIACFSSMRKLSKVKTLVTRSRYLLRDVLDVREAGWPKSIKNHGVIHAAATHVDSDATKVVDDIMSKAAAAPASKCAQKITIVEAPECKFDLKAFRRNLAAILSDLTSDRNVSAAVRRVRLAEVPLESQAEQFCDLITRIVEEKRGPPRRCAMAFAAGLAAADGQSAFDGEKCLEGLVSFFQDVYPDLCNEVPRLPAIVRSELTPTFCSVFPSSEINSRLPPGARFSI